MPAPKTFPVDYVKHRKTLVDEVNRVTGRICIVAEPETQNVPRPPKPYFTLKMVSPGIKEGDDSVGYVSGTTWNRGGQRQLVVDFETYGNTHEEAYSYLALWQACLEQETTQAVLRAAGIAIWLNGSIADLSTLLNTGFEGRSHMTVEFGVTSNLSEDLGSIDVVNVEGTATTDQNTEVDIAVQVTAP